MDSTASMSTESLTERLDEIRAELGDAWAPGWRGVVDEEAAAIIDELERRNTARALECLLNHGLVEDEAMR